MSRFGVIADDFTGATDIAGNLRARGFGTVVLTQRGIAEGPEHARTAAAPYEAVVVALKTRSAPVRRAVQDSLAALQVLREMGCAQFYDKYCSTFDSTPRGNIGPVLDALSDELDVSQVVVAPSFPATGRTVHDGLLYVHGELLERSAMRHHPLTPMTDSRIASLLRPQTRHTVAEIHQEVVSSGPDLLAAALRAQGARYVVIDASTEQDLRTIAEAVAHHRLISGASGVALGLTPEAGCVGPGMAVVAGSQLVLSGSASASSRGQVDHARTRIPSMALDIPAILADPGAALTRSRDWLAARGDEPTVMLYAADSNTHIDGASVGASAPAIEQHLASVAADAPRLGFTRLLVAGGETSGAVVDRLGATALVVGPPIGPGVCWTSAITAEGAEVNLALKSGNFGAVDIFRTAWAILDG